MLWKQISRRKSLEHLIKEMAGEDRLQRVLGPIALTSLGIGAIIGSGIFVLTGKAAAQDAGPALMISFAIAAVGCALAAFCYAEFAAMAPVAGSAYTYAYTTLGELLAWIIGWDLILEYSMSCSVVASSWSGYLNELLGALGLWQIPPQLSLDPFTTKEVGGQVIQGVVNLPAAAITLLVTGVLVLGIRQSATTNALLVLVKLAVVVFVILVGWSFINPGNWHSLPVESRLIPEDPAEKWGLLGLLGLNERLLPLDERFRTPFTPYGLSGLMLGASIVFFAYIGFDAISTHSEEARRPQRDVPLGIIASLIICTILYIAVAATITGMVPYYQLDLHAPIAAAFSAEAQKTPTVALRLSTILVAAGGLAGLTSVLLVSFLSQARVFMAMARDGLLPRLFGEVHARFRTPHLATMLTGGVISIVAAVVPIQELAEMVNIGTLLAFVVVCAAVLILRIQRPDAERPFRCPAVYLIAPLGILVNVLLMLFLPLVTWGRLMFWLGAGLLIYYFYGRHHSVLGHELSDEIRQHGASPSDAPLKI
ncbi:MAG: amino acid permease [Planctomycetaceae bacterium]|nr:amino acid permease [Planctomycetaceae bacterium]